MANQHKIVVYVKPRRLSVDVELRCHGNILRLDLAGYNLSLDGIPIPTTLSEKAYVTAVFNAIIPLLL